MTTIFNSRHCLQNNFHTECWNMSIILSMWYNFYTQICLLFHAKKIIIENIQMPVYRNITMQQKQHIQCIFHKRNSNIMGIFLWIYYVSNNSSIYYYYANTLHLLYTNSDNFFWCQYFNITCIVLVNVVTIIYKSINLTHTTVHTHNS